MGRPYVQWCFLSHAFVADLQGAFSMLVAAALLVHTYSGAFCPIHLLLTVQDAFSVPFIYISSQDGLAEYLLFCFKAQQHWACIACLLALFSARSAWVIDLGGGEAGKAGAAHQAAADQHRPVPKHHRTAKRPPGQPQSSPLRCVRNNVCITDVGSFRLNLCCRCC